MKLLNKIQKELKAPKNQYNSFGKYNYRNCEDILEAVKPLLENGTLKLEDEVVNIGNHNYVKSTAILKDGDEIETASAYAREAVDQKGMNDSQITGSTSSYARKYALNGLFLIDDTKDSDATNTHGKESRLAIKPITKTPTPEEATTTALNKINNAQSIKELMELDQKITDSKYIPADKKIDLALELQDKILTFDPTQE